VRAADPLPAASAAGQSSDYVAEEWRQDIVQFMQRVNHPVHQLKDLGSKVPRPKGLPPTIRLTAILREDPSQRFELTGEGNSLTVRLAKTRSASARPQVKVEAKTSAAEAKEEEGEVVAR